MSVNIRDRVERVLSLVVTISAVIVAAAVVRREFLGSRASAAPVREPNKPEYVDGWEELLGQGVWVGDSGAKVKIVEFGDFECPYCAAFHTRFSKVQATFGSLVVLHFVHFPLDNHRFARSAAIASECANDQGVFGEYASTLFAKQDSLGLKSWWSYAKEAGAVDSNRFGTCVAQAAYDAKVNANVSLAVKYRVRGTPTVIINGWKAPGTPTDSVLARAVRAAANGKEPFGKLE